MTRAKSHRPLPALALVASVFLLPIRAQAAAAQGYVQVLVLPQEDRPDLMRPVLAIGDANGWMTSADYPAAALKAGLRGWATVRVSVNARDQITNCRFARGSAGILLQQLACRQTRARGHFRHALSAAGLPVADTVEVQFNFTIGWPAVNPPAPPQVPPGGYSYEAGLRVVKEPDWAAFAPSGQSSGEVAVSLYLPTGLYGASTGRYCSVESGSGNKALDEASCAAVKAGEYERIATSEYGDSLKMLIRWDKGKARYALPSQPRPTPLAITGGDAAVRPALAPGAVTARGWAEVTFYPGGRTDCLMVNTTGSDATDRAICRHVKTKVTFTPEKDIFGRDVKAKRYFRFDP